MHWSNGQYDYPTNLQDDIGIIAGVVGYRPNTACTTVRCCCCPR